VLLALRRLGDPELASFLHDPLPALRTEAARAILDADVQDALPALAEMAGSARAEDEAFLWRSLNANRIVGTPECGLRLLAFARDPLRAPGMRVEAIAILAEWSAPHGQDRVVGDWRPIAHPDAGRVLEAVAAAVPALLDDPADDVVRAAADAAGTLRLLPAAPALLSRVGERQRPGRVREAALSALDLLDAPELDAAVGTIEPDAPGRLREAAVRIFARRNPDRALPVLASLLENGSRREKRGAFAALGDLRGEAAAGLVLQWLDRLQAGEVDPGAQLELLEAAAQRTEPAVKDRLALRERGLPEGDGLAPFRESLQGGDAGEGRRLFFRDERARCQRCHSVDGRGGEAGPRLDGIGARVTREHLLESLVAPGAGIADGYATVVLHLHNGEMVAGIAVRDQDGGVEVMDVDGNQTRVPWDRIKERRGTTTSSMPAMGGALSRRELRDLVEFLAQLQ
jgi:quinoprotein glucose dehydrogenase